MVGLVQARLEDLIRIEGRRLREVRTRLRLSGPQIEARSGVSQSTVSRLERDLMRVAPGTFWALVACLATEGGTTEGAMADYLLGHTEGLVLSPIMYEP